MFPGPTIIKHCANCAQPFGQETLLSGNTFGTKFWTDGKREAPMLPDQGCPHSPSQTSINSVHDEATYPTQ